MAEDWVPVTAYYPGSYMAMAALATSALSPQTVKKATRADLLNKGPLDLLSLP